MSKHFTKKQPNKAVFSTLNEAECLQLEQIQLCVCVCVLVAQSCPTLATPWTVARQAPPSTEFSRQEYWSRLPFPSAGDWTQVSCIAGRFFTSWVTRGAFKERYWKLSHKNKGIWERIGWLRKLWIHSKWIKKDNVNTYVLVGCSNCSYERPKTF